MRVRGCAWLAVALLLGSVPAEGANAQPDQEQLKRLSLEELMNVDVTLTSRRPEPVGTTAAAVSVITAEDIRRSGVTTIADAVGLATGIHAARFNNGTWAITSRGFNAVTANKLLVMIDGRTVYSPLFSGVFWNIVDYTLDDIDRIEVVRGPGATLWGANAVNGVINIVTRHARDTLGTLASVGAGNEDPLVADVRYGASSGEVAYRVYAKYAIRDSQRLSSGASAGDRRNRGQVGVRLDRGASLMLKGDLFFSRSEFPDRDDGTFLLADAQARVTRVLSPRADLQVQAYLNHEHRDVPLQLTHTLTTVDVDAQHTITLARQNIVWGGGARVNRDSTAGTAVVSFVPANRTVGLLNGFVESEMAVVPQRLFVSGGIKVERNAFSGIEIQPGARARVLLPRNQMVWGAVSRALRRPTRFEEDIRSGTPQGIVVAVGSRDFEPERLIATEVGYRARLFPVVTSDATVFHHSIDRLRSQEAPASGPPIPIVIGNTLNGTATGIELSVTVQPLDWWNAEMSYTGQDVSITRDPGSRDVGAGTSEANDPAHLFALRNSIDAPGGVELDFRFRRVAALPRPFVPGYTELDFRVGWALSPRVMIALIGQDMLHDRHAEFNPTGSAFEEFERSVRVSLTLRGR